eukprot:1489120-Pyramimonas_sp.AAC.1
MLLLRHALGGLPRRRCYYHVTLPAGSLAVGVTIMSPLLLRTVIITSPARRFACRGAGSEGRKKFQAPLADPYAEPNLGLEPEVDLLLRA